MSGYADQTAEIDKIEQVIAQDEAAVMANQLDDESEALQQAA
jgi:hypothetical protein